MAVIGWVLLSLLFIILLLLILPHGVTIEYIDTWRLRVLLFGVIPVWSKSGDQKKTFSESAEEASTSPPKTAEKSSKKDKPSLVEELKNLHKQEGLSGILSLFGSILRIAKDFLGRFAHSITIRDLQLCVRIGCAEADKTAIRYGEICSVLFPLLSALASQVHMRHKIVRVQPDFVEEGIDVRMRMKLLLYPMGILAAAVVAFVKLIGVWLKSTKPTQTSTISQSKINNQV